VDLEPLEKPLLPPLPEREGGWLERTVEMWEAWRSDPVTSQYGPADVAAIKDLARLFEDPKVAPNELRLRMDGLGLTPKGKRDLRWRTPAEVATIGGQGKRAEVRKLRVVAPEPKPTA
jgi:hypothetical protein